MDMDMTRSPPVPVARGSVVSGGEPGEERERVVALALTRTLTLPLPLSNGGLWLW
jgi:hypothetical protein